MTPEGERLDHGVSAGWFVRWSSGLTSGLLTSRPSGVEAGGNLPKRHPAAERHEEHAFIHDGMAAMHRGRGDEELAELERREAELERQLADLDRERARIIERRAAVEHDPPA